MIEFGFIAALILLNGFFAAAEMAFVTARPSRLRTLAEQGSVRAERVLETKADSGDFLAMVQIGVTLVASLASAVGGASAARSIAPQLEPFVGIYAEQVALALIVLGITYATLVVGELVPKQLAIRYAEALSMAIVRPLNLLQRLLWLPIRVLNISTRLILRLFGDSRSAPEIESAEEITQIVHQAANEGVINNAEEALISRIFSYAEANLADVMTPRPNIVYLEQEQTVREVYDLSEKTGFSRYIVVGGELDEFKGYIHVKDLLPARPERAVSDFIRELTVLPETLRLPMALQRLTRDDSHIAVVIDEFGSVSGLVSMEDILEEIVGEIEDEYSVGTPTIMQDVDQSWLVDGATSLNDIRNLIGIELPETADFNTLAGYILHTHQALPKEGITLYYDEFEFVIEEVEQNRIALVRIHHHGLSEDDQSEKEPVV